MPYAAPRVVIAHMSSRDCFPRVRPRSSYYARFCCCSCCCLRTARFVKELAWERESSRNTTSNLKMAKLYNAVDFVGSSSSRAHENVGRIWKNLVPADVRRNSFPCESVISTCIKGKSVSNWC